MDSVNILDALGDWATREGPLYRRLAMAIRDAIDSGHLAPGYVLPTERSLARTIAVGRSTVVAAYDVLRSEQALESRQGSGTWVSGPRLATAAEQTRAALRGTTPDAAEGLIDLATASAPAVGSLDGCLDELDSTSAARLLSRYTYSPLGLPELRETVAEMFTADGLFTTPTQIMITTGEQQALALLTEQFISPAALALVEDPTSAGLLDLLRTRRATIRSMPSIAASGADGVIATIESTQPALVYLSTSPSPAGIMADRTQTTRLKPSLNRMLGVTIEDTSSRELSFVPPPPYLASSVDADRVVTIGSMSKLYWSGLRVGWIRASAGQIERLGRIKVRADLGTPLLSQFVARSLIERREDARRLRLNELQEQLEWAEMAVHQELPHFRWERPHGGLSLWLELPHGTSAPFTEVARRFGVVVVAGSSLSAGGSSDRRIRIAYCRTVSQFREGLQRLAKAWAHYSSTSSLLRGDNEPWSVF